jgi:hypothetical protein
MQKMTDFTDRLTELSEQLHHREYWMLDLYSDKSDLEVRMHELDEAIDVSRDVIHETYGELHKLVMDHIGGTDDEVEEFIDWQLTRHLTGEASFEDVTDKITDACDRLATATKVHNI